MLQLKMSYTLMVYISECNYLIADLYTLSGLSLPSLSVLALLNKTMDSWPGGPFFTFCATKNQVIFSCNNVPLVFQGNMVVSL
jgi:hypothetical protein